MNFNKAKAQAVLAELTLGANTRRFADRWLDGLGEDGNPGGDLDADQTLSGHMVSFEIMPGMIRIRRAGRSIVEAVGLPLEGMDYLQLAPPAQRPLRLQRMCAVVEGAISRHQRWVTNTAGKVHIIHELAVPCGLSENGLPMITTYVDLDNPGSIGHVPSTQGAMNIAPVYESYPIV